MKNCLIIINRAAGGSKRISFEQVEKCLGEEYVYVRRSLPDDSDPDPRGYDAVAVCGGDGTLSSVLAKIYDKATDVWYFPVGTLNDKAKAERYEEAKTVCPSCGGAKAGKQIIVGKYESISGAATDLASAYSEDCAQADCAEVKSRERANGRAHSENSLFTYVLATGAFTPIGYTSKPETKKKLGVFAYIGHVFKEYRVNRIKADIDCGTKRFEGEFNLIMFVKSPRCFGFPFNKAYDAESESGHLVAIRSPKHGGALGLIEMFFPFFRVFFLGLKKEREGKIIFQKICAASVTHHNDVNYCRDGELEILPAGTHEIKFVRSQCNFSVIEKF